MSLSIIRQNYHAESEALVNKQINMELYASYVYMSMAAYFDRDDVALHGFAKFFRDNSTEEREHSMEFMKYQNMRGGRVVFQDIAKPNNDEWGSALEAVQAAFDLEKKVNHSLLEIHAIASKHNDAQMTDFLEGTFLKEQVEAIKHLGDLITKMKRAGDGIGVHIIDKELSS
jgi:ferritin heavy chain